MVMKELFSKENFAFSGFDKKQRTQSLIVFGLLALAFIISAFSFMNAFYCFVDVIGSIVSGSADVAIYDLLRSLPLFLTLFMAIWSMLLVHAFFRNVSDEKRVKSLYKNGFALIGFAAVCIIYVIVGLISGKYLSIVEGSPSALFPLNTVIASVLYCAVGVFAILYAKKYQEKFPYVVPSRGPIVNKGRFGYCLAISLWMLIALFCFAGFWMGLFIIDFRHGYGLYGAALLIIYCINAFFFICWELYFNELTEEGKKKVLLPLAIIASAISVIAIAFYFIVLGTNLDAPANMGFGLLPVAFAASVNIATMLVVATPLIVSIVALIKGLLIRKK